MCCCVLVCVHTSTHVCTLQQKVGLNPGADNFFIFVSIVFLEGLAGLGMLPCLRCWSCLCLSSFVPHSILSLYHPTAFGIMISALVPNEKIAMAISPAFLVFMMLFAGTMRILCCHVFVRMLSPIICCHLTSYIGFYVNTESMPVWLAWIRFLSFLFYAFSGLMVNEFQVCCGGYAALVGACMRGTYSSEMFHCTGCMLLGM